jgi:hypothetical protein
MRECVAFDLATHRHLDYWLAMYAWPVRNGNCLSKTLGKRSVPKGRLALSEALPVAVYAALSGCRGVSQEAALDKWCDTRKGNNQESSIALALAKR